MVKGNGWERERQLLEGLNKTMHHSENLDLEVENQHGSYKVTKQKFKIPLVIALTTGFWMVNYLFMSFSLADEWFNS